MRIKIYILLSIVVLFIFLDVLLFFRYASWDIKLTELNSFMLFVVVAEALVVASILQFKQVINPFTIYSIFIYIAGFSFLIISDKQQPYATDFIAILSISIICFVLGGIIALKTFKFKLRNWIPPLNQELSFVFLLVVFFAGIGVFIMEIRQLGYLPVLNLGGASVYDDLNANEVTSLHNFIIANSALPAMFYITYKKGMIPFWLFLLLSFVSGFIILNFFSRQFIMLFFFSMLIAINYYRNIPFIKLISIGVVCGVLFIILGELRSSSGDDVSTTTINDFLKEYAGINKPTNILETYLSLYGGVNFTTANLLTQLAVHDSYISFGAYTARPVITILPLDKELIYPLKYSSYSNLGTYVTDPFLDFRWIGVIALNFIYGFFSMNSFKNYIARSSEYYIVEWSLFMFCIFMCSFTNYFHMFFVVFIFIINRIAHK